MLSTKKCVFILIISEVVLLSRITYASDPLATEHILVPGKTMSCCKHEPYKLQRQFPVIYCYQGHPKYLVNIWESVMIQINLNPDQYDLYEGASGREVIAEFESLQSYWSFNFISWRSRDIKMNPFNSTCIGIRTDEDYNLTLNVIRVDYWRLIMCVSGIMMFFAARRLSDNPIFYYLSGILLGVFACFIFFVYFVSKLLPFKSYRVLIPAVFNLILVLLTSIFNTFHMEHQNLHFILPKALFGLHHLVFCFPIKSRKVPSSLFFCPVLRRPRPIMYGMMASGWTIGMYFFQIFWSNMRTVAVHYRNYVIAYFTISGVISFLVCYWKGPISNPRSKNIIKWTLQCIAMALIFWSSQFQEATLAIDFLLLGAHNIPFSWVTTLIYFCKRKMFTPKQKLLSEDEYHKQGVEETRKALDELRGYCSSPDCNQWKTVLRLKDPLRLKKDKRFAKFIEGESHLNDDEVLSFETESRKNMDDMLTDDDSDED